MKRLLSISFICILIDQIVKYIVSIKLPLYKPIKLINNFFYLTYVKNEGAAWNFLTGNRFLLIFIGVLIIGIIYFILIKDKKINRYEEMTYGILIGGIIGNLSDRIFRGYVIDYLDFYIFNYDYPVFNIADICIVISVMLLIYMTIKGDNYDRGKK